MIQYKKPINYLKSEEYTGANRCYPCTVTNIVILIIVSTGIGLYLSSTVLPILATFFGAVIVYFRGYLIPGTPTLTKKYLPNRILLWYGKEPRDSINTDDSLEGILKSFDIVYESGEEIFLTDEFIAKWQRQINTQNESLEEKALECLSSQHTDLILDTNEYQLIKQGTEIQNWISEWALKTDLSIAEVFNEQFLDWTDISVDKKLEILVGIRILIDICPNCEGEVNVQEKEVDTCCGSLTRVSGECNRCGEMIYSFRK